MSDFTEEQSQIMDLYGEQSNRLTRDGNTEKWKRNIRENRQYFSKGNPILAGFTAYIVCAGPSLDKNVQDLKLISERGCIVCVDAALRFLLTSGVTPDYCMMIDGSDKMVAMFEGCDTSKTILVTTPAANPTAVAMWKGPRYFVTTPYMPHDLKHNFYHLTKVVKVTKEMKVGEELFLGDNYEVEFGGVDAKIACGGNVSTSAHSFAMMYLKAQQVVFVGADFSWNYESHHYCGHEHPENVRDRTMTGTHSHKTPWGNEVLTNFSLLAFKRWHDQMARQMPGFVINATEGGIMGVTQEGEKMEYVEFLTLKEAVAKYTPKR